MKIFTFSFFLLVNTVVFAQLQKPMWELPIYIEDGTGLKDTVYLGIDPLATMGFDSLFEDSVYRAPLDSVANNKLYTYIIEGSPLRSKKSVLPPSDSGYTLHLGLWNVDSELTFTIDDRILADTLHGVKNMKWNDVQQKFVPDKYKGAQLWIYLNDAIIDLSSPCGSHGGPVISYVNGSPKQPYLKYYPVCTVFGRTTSFLNFSTPGQKFNFTIRLELKPMNILGSPLVGIKELEDLNVQIYPNPIKDQVTINNQESQPYTAVIYDNLSRQMRRLQVGAFRTVQVDLSDLPSGMYIIELRDFKNSTFKKVLKY